MLGCNDMIWMNAGWSGWIVYGVVCFLAVFENECKDNVTIATNSNSTVSFFTTARN